MGCDIHMVTEVKVDGTWYAYGTPDIPRSYKLFGQLAGVRRPEYRMFSPKGFPTNASLIARKLFESLDVDAHTPSYLTAAEIRTFCEAQDDPWAVEAPDGYRIGYLDGNSWTDEYPDWVQDVRWVFWFDN